jgi:DNA repair protein RadC
MDKPIDRLTTLGVTALSDTELLSILMDSQSAYSISEIPLSKIAGMSVRELAKFPKMTQRKAAILTCAFEINRRRAKEQLFQTKIVSSIDVVDYLKARIGDEQVENFYVIYLNKGNRILDFEKLSQGGISGTVADPRVILKKSLEINAVALILSHNHPSGSIKPSTADEAITQKIKEAAKNFDIKVLDHIIVGADGYFSFADEGLLY